MMTFLESLLSSLGNCEASTVAGVCACQAREDQNFKYNKGYTMLLGFGLTL